MVAAQVVRELPLPAPEPEIEPGEMLVGIKACLESGAELTHKYSEQTILGPIAISARSELTVDWGDGTPVEQFEGPGTPWPDCSVPHVYQDSGSYDVVVTQRWVVDWSVAGQTGTIGTGLSTTGTIEDFPVEAREAVVTDAG